jgi:hypothetical protein
MAFCFGEELISLLVLSTLMVSDPTSKFYLTSWYFKITQGQYLISSPPPPPPPPPASSSSSSSHLSLYTWIVTHGKLQ